MQALINRSVSECSSVKRRVIHCSVEADSFGGVFFIASIHLLRGITFTKIPFLGFCVMTPYLISS